MLSRPLAFGVLAAACVGGAAGAYFALREPAPAPISTISTAPFGLPSGDSTLTASENLPLDAVAETEATVPAVPDTGIVSSPTSGPKASGRVEAAARSKGARPVAKPKPSIAKPADVASREPAEAPPTEPPPPPPGIEKPWPSRDWPEPSVAAPSIPVADTSVQQPPEPAAPEPPPAPAVEELLVPAEAVIGLQIETAVTSERARVEDRVEARVTRDVKVGDRVAIPAGSRVQGSVTEVERGGKVKERARLGIRFHTLVLADGSTVPLRTETVFREGASPGPESTAKIGGAAVGGAILGAILGGTKGAVIGGTAGAAGGTAAVMAGDRNAAVLATGSTITVRLAEPASITVEREE